jgi:hypothetical protein
MEIAGNVVRRASALRTAQKIDEELEEEIFAWVTSEDDSGSDWEASRKSSRKCRVFYGSKVCIPSFFFFFCVHRSSIGKTTGEKTQSSFRPWWQSGDDSQKGQSQLLAHYAVGCLVRGEFVFFGVSRRRSLFTRKKNGLDISLFVSCGSALTRPSR